MGGLKNLLTCGGCNCRRRTIVNRLVPAILQLMVVVVIWYIFNSRSREGMARVARSGGSGPLCSPGDYLQGKVLHLNNIMTSKGDSDSVADGESKFLKAEVIVRDIDQENLVLYPVGTPVLLEGGAEDKTSDNDFEIEDEKEEKKEDNDTENKDNSDDKDNSDTKVEETENKDDTDVKSENEEKEQLDEKKSPFSYGGNSDDKSAFGTSQSNSYSQTYNSFQKPKDQPSPNSEFGLSMKDVDFSQYRNPPNEFANNGNGGQKSFGQGMPSHMSGQDVSFIPRREQQTISNGGMQQSYDPRGQSPYMRGMQNSNNEAQNSFLMNSNDRVPNNFMSNSNDEQQNRFMQSSNNGIPNRFMSNSNDEQQNRFMQNSNDDQQNRFMQSSNQENQREFTPNRGDDQNTDIRNEGSDDRASSDREQPMSDNDVPGNQGDEMSSHQQSQDSGSESSQDHEDQNPEVEEKREAPPIMSESELANSVSSDGDTDVAVDEDGPVYTDGFHQRVAWFKTEYYGKPVEPAEVDVAPKFLLNNPSLCEGEKPVDLLYLVNAQPQSDDQRKAVRESFVDSSAYEPFRVAHVFVVGQTTSPNFQNNLNKEHEQFGDIVQGDFMDKPENATRKGLMGMRWALKYCSAKYVMKVDESVFVDTEKLLRGLIPAAEGVVGKRSMFCPLARDAPVPRSGPRAFSHDLFPHREVLRPHCLGYAVLMTRGVLRSILVASRHAPYVHIEDVYLYGVLPLLAGHIEVYDVGNKRAFHNLGSDVVNCYKEMGDKCPLIASKAGSAKFNSLKDFVKERMASPHPGWEGEASLWDIKSFKSSFAAI